MDIKRIFTYHPPQGSQPLRYETIRNEGRAFAKTLDKLCPDSEELTIAIRKLQEVVMFANAAIAINENKIPEPEPESLMSKINAHGQGSSYPQSQESYNNKVEFIAELCHEVNRAYCSAIGDNSQPTWENAPEWQKNTVREGVIHILDYPWASTEKSHEKWMKNKLSQGWCYGPRKDAKLKTHPCLLPYEELPKEEKAKDYILSAIVKFYQRKFNENI